ncbi:MAG TPA: Lrp/AsnC family transcriptional regulator [Puia sp.]|jgi:Lrp/AsnC family leucine-responsive transcriptional regulator
MEKEQFHQPGYEPPDPGPPSSRSVPPSPGTATSSPGTVSSSSLDAIDIRILNLLQEDGRLSVRELAKRAGLSPTPVHERLKRLEASGVIDHYAAVINTGKIGQLIIFFVNIVLKEHSTRLGGEFIRQITSFPEVVEFHVIGGEHDFMIKVIVPDMTAYRRFFIQQLGEIPNIAKLQSIIVLDTPKKDNRIPL